MFDLNFFEAWDKLDEDKYMDQYNDIKDMQISISSIIKLGDEIYADSDIAKAARAACIKLGVSPSTWAYTLQRLYNAYVLESTLLNAINLNSSFHEKLNLVLKRYGLQLGEKYQFIGNHNLIWDPSKEQNGRPDLELVNRTNDNKVQNIEIKLTARSESGKLHSFDENSFHKARLVLIGIITSSTTADILYKIQKEDGNYEAARSLNESVQLINGLSFIKINSPKAVITKYNLK